MTHFAPSVRMDVVQEPSRSFHVVQVSKRYVPRRRGFTELTIAGCVVADTIVGSMRSDHRRAKWR
jgi:hypothetical protein